MTLLRLNRNSDITTDGGRGQLQETLELYASKLREFARKIRLIEEADKIVRPVPIEEFPVAIGPINTGEEGGNIGDVVWRAVRDTPAGFLVCDGSLVSRTTYSDLFAKIGTTYGSTDSTNFRTPDLRGRVPVGVGTGTGLTARALAATGGQESVLLAQNHIPLHSHGMEHQHGTTLDIYTQDAGGTPGNRPQRTTVYAGTNTYTGPNTGNVVNSPLSGPNTGNNDAGGSKTAHENMQPFLVLAPYIRYRLGPSDTIQKLPLAWGRVNANWELDTLKNFPKSSVTNLHQVAVTDGRPEGVVKVSAIGGNQAGTSSANKIEALIPIPYNFRRWRTQGLLIRTRIEMTGVTGSATLTLKVSDPNVAGGYLGTTKVRTVAASGGNISDGKFVDIQLTAEELGRDWKPGYMLRFELVWGIPKTFTTADLYVGFLGIYM